ncbi:MAG: hypothetical protein RsTaC01_0069 [Candidatus Paraimprobicoccus trichonymphae]|uniref:Tyrosine specific protein phosphatases domain-containing protein n=1 Tax=Candidatus Paraimprobicoccus trichonymphae TaxID=3033793 RepID=A0AA48HVU2_9FIRM|nr:MAG: hypothetical protein RsTaC01_0069 [Candidatus Paraimprobicoccus trichonymphae]
MKKYKKKLYVVLAITTCLGNTAKVDSADFEEKTSNIVQKINSSPVIKGILCTVGSVAIVGGTYFVLNKFLNEPTKIIDTSFAFRQINAENVCLKMKCVIDSLSKPIYKRSLICCDDFKPELFKIFKNVYSVDNIIDLKNGSGNERQKKIYKNSGIKFWNFNCTNEENFTNFRNILNENYFTVVKIFNLFCDTSNDKNVIFNCGNKPIGIIISAILQKICDYEKNDKPSLCNHALHIQNMLKWMETNYKTGATDNPALNCLIDFGVNKDNLLTFFGTKKVNESEPKKEYSTEPKTTELKTLGGFKKALYMIEDKNFIIHSKHFDNIHDFSYLKNRYNIQQVIDLRVKSKADNQEKKFMQANIKFSNFYIKRCNKINDFDEKEGPYVKLLNKCSGSIINVFDLISNLDKDKNGSIVIYCHKGLKRTGLISILLHMLLNYAESEIFFRNNFFIDDTDQNLKDKHKKNMKNMVEWVKQTHSDGATANSAANWLLKKEFGLDKINKIRALFELGPLGNIEETNSKH